jgi:tripartite-type tricarboxylate transporter receptor subunit TctC
LAEVRDARALIELAKRKPGMNFGSSGSGGGLHLTGEMFKLRAGIDIQHVSYRGANLAMNDILAGQLDMTFDNVSGALPFIRDGRVRALAVTSAARLPELPDVPTMAELGLPGMEVGAWFGVLGPADLPPEILERLAREVSAVLDDPRVVEQFARIGLAIKRSESPAAFTAYFRQDIATWREVVQAAGVTFDPN